MSIIDSRNAVLVKQFSKGFVQSVLFRFVSRDVVKVYVAKIRSSWVVVTAVTKPNGEVFEAVEMPRFQRKSEALDFAENVG